MESALSATAPTFTFFSISNPLNRHFSNSKYPPIAPPIHTHLFSQGRVVSPLASLSYSSPPRSLCAASIPKRLHRRLDCVASSNASSGTGGGGGGVFGGDDGSGGGGGGEGMDGGDSKTKLGAGAADELSALPADVIILDVGGMSCGGCAASVKRILESQPQVSSATVNLTTETAIVWPVSDAKVVPNWQKELGEALARQLTSCGFKSNLRVAGQEAIEGDLSA
ncbi:copper-transporting ATPase PAA1, chloroplastic-like isoform X2 [Durio zibethinus]|uniref:Copper-transporting ATPase PAA1, chloroplastic-like isoform X2 n=1 Tax=Durio zibethinus TaxID=66656 RepID=A0A6P5XG01_DURZI|nr:copper-transporting ATPase PAA1, chloroplastic-like isoform X2 [Durio zibethinus]